jgi:protein-S-isoprenylcysteine O-methyltransferase Ste14
MPLVRSVKSSTFIKIENGFNTLVAAIGNAVLIFVTFLVSVPAMVMPMTRGWLKLHGYMVVVCAVFTLILGLSIWFETLKTRSRLGTIWNNQPAATQSLIQQEVGY